MTSREFQVLGMTCGHCVTFVTEELERLPGVTAVAVDLSAGTVTVTSEQELGLPQIQTAVEEAGYELAEQPTGNPSANGSGRQP
jgi:copper chaperone CopZ